MELTSVLAVTVTIAFQGLLVFQSDGHNQKHVVIVDARAPELYNHVPKLVICAAPGYQACTEVSLKKDDKISFDNSPGAIDLDAKNLYKDHVPTLKDFIVYGDIDPSVVNAQHGGEGVFALIELPAGRITTLGGFPEMVQLSKGGLIRRRVNKCFARYVIVEASVSPTLLFVQHSDGSSEPPKTIHPDDLIIVSNIANDPDHHLHFPLYNRILTHDGQLGPVRILAPADGQCDVDVGKGLLNNHAVEGALLSGHVPHGDCGPTGP